MILSIKDSAEGISQANLSYATKIEKYIHVMFFRFIKSKGYLQKIVQK